jgi:hypothetical protein
MTAASLFQQGWWRAATSGGCDKNMEHAQDSTICNQQEQLNRVSLFLHERASLTSGCRSGHCSGSAVGSWLGAGSSPFSKGLVHACQGSRSRASMGWKQNIM